MVNADGEAAADVLILGGLIAEVGPSLRPPPGARVIDAAGKLVMPGGVDPHTHLAMPFMGQVACDDFFTGQAAALAGGTTFHIDFALPVGGDPLAGFREWRRKAEGAAVMDYALHVAVTSWDEGVAAAMGELAARHGVNSFKFFLAYKGSLMVGDAELLAGLRRCAALGALAMVHAENGDAVAEGQARVWGAGVAGPEGHALSRPEGVEAEATARAARLAELAGAPLYVVHVMGREAAEEVARARARGARIVGETVAAAIALEESALWHPNFTVAAQFVMSPPIRSRASGAAVRAALASGALQVLATDHAAFNSTQKAAGAADFRRIPNGVNGLEERLHVAWEELVNSGLATRTEFVRAVSTAAARAFNAYPRKGLVAPGSDADVVVFDPDAVHVISAATHHSAMDTNVYEGKRIRGKVVTTVAGGRVVWHEGRLHVARGVGGRYVGLPTGGPLFEGLGRREEEAFAAYGGAPVRREASGGGGERAAANKDEL